MNEQPDLFNLPLPILPKREDISDTLLNDMRSEIAREAQGSETAAQRLGIPHQLARQLIRRLFEQKRVEDSGERVMDATFQRAIVWRVVP